MKATECPHPAMGPEQGGDLEPGVTGLSVGTYGVGFAVCCGMCGMLAEIDEATFERWKLAIKLGDRGQLDKARWEARSFLEEHGEIRREAFPGVEA